MKISILNVESAKIGLSTSYKAENLGSNYYSFEVFDCKIWTKSDKPIKSYKISKVLHLKNSLCIKKSHTSLSGVLAPKVAEVDDKFSVLSFKLVAIIGNV